MVAMNELPLAELTRFGIVPQDEHPHPFSSEYEWWNESVFYDWYDRSGQNAGHCRTATRRFTPGHHGGYGD